MCVCAVPSIFFHIYLQQNDLLDDLAAYFLFLILYDKTLAIWMLTTNFLNSRVQVILRSWLVVVHCSFTAEHILDTKQ